MTARPHTEYTPVGPAITPLLRCPSNSDRRYTRLRLVNFFYGRHMLMSNEEFLAWPKSGLLGDDSFIRKARETERERRSPQLTTTTLLMHRLWMNRPILSLRYSGFATVKCYELDQLPNETTRLVATYRTRGLPPDPCPLLGSQTCNCPGCAPVQMD
jgi:hypothetical protein